MHLALKYAFRQLALRPGFTFASLLMLALGIAMSTSMFSITNDALLRPLPFPDPDQLVRVFTTSPQADSMMIAPGNAIELSERFSDLGTFGLFMQHVENVAEPGQPPEQMYGITFSANALKILGAQPVLGRGFLADEDQPGKPPVVMLTNRFWKDRFAGDPGVLGKVLRIGTTSETVIGVLPAYFDEPLLFRGCNYVNVMTVWPNWRDQRSAKWMSVLGRLSPGISLSTAQSRADQFAAQLMRDHAAEVGSMGLRVATLSSSFVGSSGRTIYWLLVGLAVLVLVIACANLGGVQLARGFTRRGELAVRAALGATRRDLLLLLAMEGLVIAGVGTVFGVLLSYWVNKLIPRLLGGDPIAMDGRVLVFAALAGLLAVICFGLVPAWMTSRTSVVETMKEFSRGITAGRTQQRAKLILVAGQLSLALVLICTTCSFVLGVRAFLHRDRGWQPEGLVSGTVNVPYEWVKKEEANPVLAQQLRTRLAAIPGVSNVATASSVPIYGYQDQQKFMIEGAAPVPGHEPMAFVTGVDARFFSTLGIKLREGRLLPDNYRRGDLPVIVISASTARRFWPDESALGKRVQFSAGEKWHEVIGVVADVSLAVGFDTPATNLQAYRPIEELATPWYNFVIQTSLPVGTLEKSIRSAIGAIDPDIKVGQIGNVAETLARIASGGPLAAILTTFASAGLAIAIVGLYALMSQLTQQRQREIGVRIALGADYRRIVTMMLSYAVRLLLVGIVAGLVGAYVVSIVFHKSFPELHVPGLVIQILIGLALGMIGIAASFLPARRAARLNPVEVLRGD